MPPTQATILPGTETDLLAPRFDPLTGGFRFHRQCVKFLARLFQGWRQENYFDYDSTPNSNRSSPAAVPVRKKRAVKAFSRLESS